MNEYMKDAIATHAWHEFIYCKNNEERKSFLDSMRDDYVIKLDSNEPAVVFVDDFMLPTIDIGMRTMDTRVKSIAREYLSFTLVAAIVEQTIQQNKLEELNQKMVKFIKDVNRLYINDDEFHISDVSGLLDALKKSKEFYRNHYVELMHTGEWSGDFSTIPISFMEFSMFITAYKRALGRSSHIGMVLDYQGSGAVVSQRAVNGIVTKRIAGDAPMKIVCEPGEWKTYHDLNGVLAEDVHDYSSIDLDGSHREYVKRLMNKR
jgi:hypothetical protein